MCLESLKFGEAGNKKSLKKNRGGRHFLIQLNTSLNHCGRAERPVITHSALRGKSLQHLFSFLSSTSSWKHAGSSFYFHVQNALPCRLTVHAVFLIGQQLWHGPKGVFLIHVHQQQGGDLTHPLAVAHLLQATEPNITALPRPAQLCHIPAHSEALLSFKDLQQWCTSVMHLCFCSLCKSCSSKVLEDS